MIKYDTINIDEQKHQFLNWIRESDSRLQAIYDWYKGYDDDSLEELVIDFLNEIFVPIPYDKTFEDGDMFGVRDKNTHELLFVSDEPEEVRDYIDEHLDNWDDERFNHWYGIAQQIVNEFGYYNFSDEEV